MRSPEDIRHDLTAITSRRQSQPPRKRRGSVITRVASHLVTPLVLVIVLIGVWQAWIVIFDIHALVMPTPRDVFSELFADPTAFLSDTAATVKHAGLGLALGTLLGYLLAVASWFSPIVSTMVSTPAILLRATPIAAMTPVIARMFGYNENSVVAVAVLISFFPTYVFVASGLRDVSPISNEFFTVLHASRITRLLRLVLPAAIPSLLLSLRVSGPIAVLGALVAEWLIGVEGLGALLSISGFTYQVSTVWAGAILGTLLGVLTFSGANQLEKLGRARWT